MHVLIVEDDEVTAAFLKKGLASHGIVADIANNGADGLDLALKREYDLIILDVMLPKLSGWAVMESLRRNSVETPVLFLSARDAVEDRIRGLYLGGDDYLGKPFSFSELLARLRCIVRRGQIREQDFLQIADLKVDMMRRKVSRAGKNIILTAKEFDLLALFVQRRGEVLSRSMIADLVWGVNFETHTNAVDVGVHRMRGKVDDPFPEKLIHAVRGVGYVMECH